MKVPSDHSTSADFLSTARAQDIAGVKAYQAQADDPNRFAGVG